MIWNITSQYYEGTTPNFQFKKKIAVFDLDGTLMQPLNSLLDKKNLKKIMTGYTEWEFVFPTIPDIIGNYFHNESYSIVIISNQLIIGKGKFDGNKWQEKIEEFAKIINVEFKIFCSIEKNFYRKPSPRFIIDFFPKNNYNNNKDFFFCGDACGRENDFSDSDVKFAYNTGLAFFTPEHIFCGSENVYPEIKYPLNFTEMSTLSKNSTFDYKPFSSRELVIMVGFQGSGKSFASNFIKEKYGYEIVSADIEKTTQKCVKLTNNHMKNNRNIVIDNTSPGKSHRKLWIDIAKNFNYNVTVINMNTSREHSEHNNLYRSIFTGGKFVPTFGYINYSSKYKQPDVSEGIDNIVFANMIPPKDKNYYKYFY